MPGLERTRRLRVYLPPDYAAQPARHYPVIYLHDGQNLFDAATGFNGEWGVDELLDRLARQQGLAAIAVGIDHGGERRNTELSPWDHERIGKGEGFAYLRFLVETVKPYVDARWRTRPESASTALIGSSLGGLVTHAALHRHREVFGLGGVLSPAFWVNEPRARMLAESEPLLAHQRLVLYGGGREDRDMLPMGAPHGRAAAPAEPGICSTSRSRRPGTTRRPGAPCCRACWRICSATPDESAAAPGVTRRRHPTSMSAAHFILYVAEPQRSRDFYAAVLAQAPRLEVPGMTEFVLPGFGRMCGARSDARGRHPPPARRCPARPGAGTGHPARRALPAAGRGPDALHRARAGGRGHAGSARCSRATGAIAPPTCSTPTGMCWRWLSPWSEPQSKTPARRPSGFSRKGPAGRSTSKVRGASSWP
jgi:predicted alpha/beta superfamily hydrolase